MTDVDTAIIYNGETTLYSGQTIEFEYIAFGGSNNRTTGAYTSTTLRDIPSLLVKKPSGEWDVLDCRMSYDGAAEIVSVPVGDSTVGARVYRTIGGTCRYKLETAGEYMFWACICRITPSDTDTEETFIESVRNGAVGGDVVIMSNMCAPPLTVTVEDGATYIEQTSVSVTHQITSTVAYADTLQWQELKSDTWENIEGETDEILTIGTWTGDPADDEETARANTNSIIPAYDRQFCCVATNEVGETKTKIMHVTHAEGNGTPTVTEEEW